jgi:hypothetical protein
MYVKYIQYVANYLYCLSVENLIPTVLQDVRDVAHEMIFQKHSQ